MTIMSVLGSEYFMLEKLVTLLGRLNVDRMRSQSQDDAYHQLISMILL
jgi:hypothetical protein